MKKVILFCLFLFISFSTKAQQKWGKISEYEKTYVSCDFEKNAKAVILGESGLGYIRGNSFFIEVHKRIKILSSENINDASVISIPFYSYDGMENVTSIKAQTINFENDKMTIDKVEDKNFFRNKKSELWSAMQFTFPNVKNGSIIEYQYTFKTNNLLFLEGWKFQHEFPTLQSSFKIEVPEGLDYKLLLRGEQLFKKYLNEKNSNTWSLNNVKSYKSIEFVYNPEANICEVSFQLNSYIKQVSAYSTGESQVDVFPKWSKLVEDLKDEYSAYIKKSAIEQFCNEMVLPEDDWIKLTTIIDKFRNNFGWNSYYATHNRKTCSEVFQQKTGNSAELNIIFNAILNQLGYNAKFVLISTRENKKVFKEYPFLSQFNSLINMIELPQNKIIFIDAKDVTSKNLGFLSLENCNGTSLLLDEKTKEPQWIEILQPISTLFYSEEYSLNDKGELLFKNHEKGNGYYNATKSSDNEVIYNALNLNLSVNTKEESEEGSYKIIRIQAKPIFFDEKIILINNPLQEKISNYTFSETERLFPLEFDFPFKEEYSITFNIPQNYTIDEDFLQKFNYNNKQEELGFYYAQNAFIIDNKLKIKYSFHQLFSQLSGKQYFKLKEFFNQISQQTNTLISLKKK